MAKGLYRTTKAQGGAEYVGMDYGGPWVDEISRALYEERGYQPAFDSLPAKEELEAEAQGGPASQGGQEPA